MQRLRYICALFIFLATAGVSRAHDYIGQALDSRLFQLYELSADQEGMFYTPVLQSEGLLSGSRPVNEQRLSAAIKSNNTKAIGPSAFNLGILLLIDGDHQRAAQYFNQAMEAYGASGNLRGKANAQLHLGFVHYLDLDFDKAIIQYNAAAVLFTNNRMSGAEAYAYILNGQACLAAKQFDKADEWFRKGYNALQLPSQKARIAVQLAELAIRKHKTSVAEDYLTSALGVFNKSGDKNGQALVYRDRGIIQMKNSAYQQAVQEFSRSMALSGQLSTAKLLKETYLKMFTLASLKGEHNRSNDINIVYLQLRDSIDNVEKGRVVNSQILRRELVEKEAIQEMLRKEKDIIYSQLSQQELLKNRELTELELDRLEKEKIIEDLNAAKEVSDQANLEREEQIRLLTQQKALQDLALSKKELEISRQETLRNSLIIGFVSLIIVALLLYNRYRNQKKSHFELDQAYSELSQTHQKLLQTQEQLVHAQKMASLGQLTAGIAHEIQNPLNFVNNFSDLSLELIREIKEPGADREAILNDLASNLEKIHSHGKRADKIVKGMLLHSRTGSAEKQPVQLNMAIDELLELSYHGSRTKNTGFSAEIIRDFDPSLPEVPIVSNDISRVLVNLFNNSFYALGEKSAQLGKSFHPTLTVTTRAEADHAVIVIRDNGIGIPKEVINKIYDPFFTTKPAGQGTGLGLSLSFEIIVKGHGGTMQVASEEGSFTEFTITLPFTTN